MTTEEENAKLKAQIELLERQRQHEYGGKAVVVLNGIQTEKLAQLLTNKGIDADNTQAVSIENMGTEHKIIIAQEDTTLTYFIGLDGKVTNDSPRL